MSLSWNHILAEGEENTMDSWPERSVTRILICLLSGLATVFLLFNANAEAELYDDFSGSGINAAKWTISDPHNLFSQPGDGQLYFYSDNTAGVNPAPSGSLSSTRTFTPGFISMDFNQFASSNVSSGGAGLGSFAALGLGTKTTRYARILRGRVVSAAWGYFEANYFDGETLHVWYVYADAVSGRLGLDYDGLAVSFFYDDGVHGWQKLDTSGPDTHGNILAVTPGWSSPPPLFVAGTPGGSGVTSFAADKVDYTVYPEIIYVSKIDPACDAHSPCSPSIQNGIDLLPGPSIIKITQETYNEDILLKFDAEIVLEGGCDTSFGACSSYSTIAGSMKIAHGTITIENIILK
jgi:hypothetical protein